MPRIARIAVHPAPVWRVLVAISLALIAIDVAFQLTTHFYDPTFPGWETVAIIMDVDSESSIPTWWAALLLTAAALLTALAALAAGPEKSRDRTYLWAIAVIFVLLSIDEQAMIHEHAIVPLRERFGFGGLLFFAWVVPAAVIVIALVALFARFVFRQPAHVRRLLIVSAGLFLTGALALEMVGGWWSESHTPDNLTYQSLTSAEELLEYLGASTYILAILHLLAGRETVAEVSFNRSETPG